MKKIKTIRQGNNIYCIPGRFHHFFEGRSIKKRFKKIIPDYLKRNNNNTFSIISNNCIGGVITHELKNQFRSPFINLSLSFLDFYKLLERIKYYISLELVEKKTNDPFPVGVLDDISIKFVHYSSFKDAKNSWDRRKTRINYNDLYITIFDYYKYDDEQIGEYMPIDLLNKIIALNYKHLVIFTTDKTKRKYNNVVYLRKYRRVYYSLVPTEIEMFGGHRIFDYKFDYVKWLND